MINISPHTCHATPVAAESAELAELAPRPGRRHRRWALAGVAEAHHTRYLLQPTAAELFMADRSGHALFNFPSVKVGVPVCLPAWLPALPGRVPLHGQHPSLCIWRAGIWH